MKKHGNALFQIGEVCKIMCITRKTLLNYEAVGLLTPAHKDEASGYRYYSADNMTQIRSIRSLQMLGLTLKEVKEYYYDFHSLDAHLQRLMELRASLDRNIQMLQVRAARAGDLTVHRATLPRQVCFCRRFSCKSVTEAAEKLRDTYLEAARTEKMSMLQRMFTVRMSQEPNTLDLMCCIPMSEQFHGAERMEFPETKVLCIYYRGPYENIVTAMHALKDYVKENKIETAGSFRSIYLEGPPNRGADSADYITQIAIPIKE